MDSLSMLSIVAKGLKDFKHEFAFVGGAAVALHITDKAAPPLRPTDDVDCVVEITSRVENQKLEEELLALGFTRPPLAEPGTICRWKYSGLSVDIMPADGGVLGFRNRWYEEGLQTSENFILPDGTTVRAFSLPYMLASKVEAFFDRGKGNFRDSHDIEDVFALLDGAPNAIETIRAGADSVRGYLSDKFKGFLKDPLFIESAEGHLPDTGRADRALKILRLV